LDGRVTRMKCRVRCRSDCMSDRNIRDEGFGLVMPFVIDGDGYSDRDRAMFVAGYEFCQLHVFLEENLEDGISRPVHA
jgi:hypothetical protein